MINTENSLPMPSHRGIELAKTAFHNLMGYALAAYRIGINSEMSPASIINRTAIFIFIFLKGNNLTESTKKNLSANDYYYQHIDLKYHVDPQEYIDRDHLAELIKNDNIEGLETSIILKHYGINYPFGAHSQTLLHIAYALNKPAVVAWLLKNGASEQNCNSSGHSPIACAHAKYEDSQPRVINEIVKRYFEASKNSVKDPHLLYDLILKFMHEKNWQYNDSQYKKIKPFRDSLKLVKLGSPEFSYQVNCNDLSHLFVKTAKKIGIKANVIHYYSYYSIEAHEKEEREIIGEFKLFDGSDEGPFGFDYHSVVYSDDYYFDLTLMCKYKEFNAVLASNKKLL